MNKQEVIKKLKAAIPEDILDNYQRGEKAGLNFALLLVEELEKPVVPQYVADFYESIKDDFEDGVYELCIQLYNCDLDGRIKFWFGCDDNKPIVTLVKMKLYGYEVEKEKLYTVKFSNEDFGKIYIGIFKKFNKLGISSLPLNDDEIKSWFTEDELKRFKFWDNPAFEINEVEEVSRLTDGAWNTLAELNGTEVDE